MLQTCVPTLVSCSWYSVWSTLSLSLRYKVSCCLHKLRLFYQKWQEVFTTCLTDDWFGLIAALMGRHLICGHMTSLSKFRDVVGSSSWLEETTIDFWLQLQNPFWRWVHHPFNQRRKIMGQMMINIRCFSLGFWKCSPFYMVSSGVHQQSARLSLYLIGFWGIAEKFWVNFEARWQAPHFQILTHPSCIVPSKFANLNIWRCAAHHDFKLK